MQEVADKLAERFGIEYDWDGDTLQLQPQRRGRQDRAGAGELHVTAQLGFLLSR